MNVLSNRAAIDIGSNSILLLIVDEKNNELCFESRITSLGKNLDKTKVFNEESVKDSYRALQEYKEICSKFNISFQNVKITATEASRVATNANDFFSQIKKDLGGIVKLITAEQEAFLSAKGVVCGQPIDEKELVLMDIGGASTELIHIQVEPFKIIKTISLPLGGVRVTDWMAQGIWDKKKTELLTAFPIASYRTSKIIGVAGTMTSLFHIVKNKKQFELSSFENNLMDYESLKKSFSSFSSFSPEELLDEFPFLGKRSLAIQGGYQVCDFLSQNLGVKNFQISFKGLVHGSVFD